MENFPHLNNHLDQSRGSFLWVQKMAGLFSVLLNPAFIS